MVHLPGAGHIFTNFISELLHECIRQMWACWVYGGRLSISQLFCGQAVVFNRVFVRLESLMMYVPSMLIYLPFFLVDLQFESVWGHSKQWNSSRFKSWWSLSKVSCLENYDLQIVPANIKCLVTLVQIHKPYRITNHKKKIMEYVPEFYCRGNFCHFQMPSRNHKTVHVNNFKVHCCIGSCS